LVLQILFLLIVIFFSLKGSIENSLLAIIFILPFQYLIKSLFTVYLGSASVISLWKEIIVVFSFFRIVADQYYNDRKINKHFPIIFFIAFLFLQLLLLAFAPVKSEALVSFKVYCFPLFVAYCCMHMVISKGFFKKLYLGILISSTLVFIVAHLQMYFLRIPFAFLMDMAEDVSASGELVFKYTASQIMGIDRMYGCFSGPNELGLYTAVIIVFLTYFLFRQQMTKGVYWLTLLIVFLGFATIIQTFSRVSWAFLGISVLFTSGSKFFKKQTIVAGLGAVLLIVFFFLTTDLGEIFLSSIKFEEASAEARPDDFFSGIEMIASNPLGFGLGTVQYSAEKPVWHTEIFWWIVFVENGILIGILLFFFYIQMAIKLLTRTKIIFAHFSGLLLIIAVVLGYVSAIIFEPIFLTILWAFVGVALNKVKLNYSTS